MLLLLAGPMRCAFATPSIPSALTFNIRTLAADPPGGHLSAMTAHGWSFLLVHLFPVLQLADLQAVGQVCRTFRGACKSLARDTWLLAARRTLPLEHPICLGSAVKPISEQADNLARLHRALRNGKPAQVSSLTTLQSHTQESLGQRPFPPSPDGTMLVSETTSHLCIYKLVLTQPLSLEEIAILPLPDRADDDGDAAFLRSFVWAPDSSMFLLLWDSWPVELYMVDMKDPELGIVTESIRSCTGVTFAPDGQSYLVGWCDDDDDPSDTSYNVFRADGQLMASFDDQADSWHPAWAFLADDRVAIAQKTSFRVWHLSSGLLLVTAGPDINPASFSWKGSGQIATNPIGSRLAFSPVAVQGAPVKLYIYAACTLQLLACLQADGGAASQDPGAVGSHFSGLFWSLHGWMLTYKPSFLHSGGYGHLQMMASQAASGVYQHAVMHGCEPYRSPALSPCSSFVLLFEQQRARLEVRDVRNGKLVLSCVVRLAKRMQTHRELEYDIALRWSSCGNRVVARVRAQAKGYDPTRFAFERIVVMQLTQGS